LFASIVYTFDDATAADRHDHGTVSIFWKAALQPGTGLGGNALGMKLATQPIAIYRKIQSDLEDRILSGAWPPGTRIPSEEDLAQQFGCSRMTVNKVLSALARSGLVSRKRRTGTVVARPMLHHTVLQLRDLRTEISEAGTFPRHAVLDRAVRRPTDEEAERLSIRRGQSVVALIACHYGDDEPALLEERLISLAAVPEAREADFSVIPPGSWLIEKVPWTSAEHRIRAANADARTAEMLELAVGDACLIVERRTFKQDVPITWVRLTYPGDRHELYGRFLPTGS